MKRLSETVSLLLLLSACAGVAWGQEAQPAGADERGVRETRVALTEAATAYDVEGRVAVGARLNTTGLAATPDAPVRNVSVVVQNRSAFFYNYASGWATFYDAQGVRCGEGLWKVEAFAPGESAEVDTPGLRLTCSPATWRVVVLNLLTRSADIAKPGQPAPQPDAAPPPAAATNPPPPTSSAPPQRLEININGKTLPLQLNNPLDIVVGQERLLIVVRPAP
ncbi:MAG: hypothetical protein LC800_04085 [Acidobacteria bacterium]|nr:hypothetical protein [Acidobacteriota bacterium]